jgi:hypothetical protein
MTTYLLFTGQLYYPLGGANDLRDVFQAESDQAAVDMANGILKGAEWAQLVALEEDLSIREVCETERTDYDWESPIVLELPGQAP